MARTGRTTRTRVVAGVAGLVVGLSAAVSGVLVARPAPVAAVADLGVPQPGTPGTDPSTGPVTPATPAGPVAPTGVATVEAPAAPVAAALPSGAPPVSLSLPRQGVDALVVPAGVLGDGQLQLPDDPGSTGWWAGGPAPGEAGPVLVGGHVRTEAAGTGALAALHEVAVGDAVVLTDSLGAEHRYVVQSRRSYPKVALPVDVLTGGDAAPRLVLVTCGGAVDPATGHYEDNVVVVAVPA